MVFRERESGALLLLETDSCTPTEYKNTHVYMKSSASFSGLGLEATKKHFQGESTKKDINSSSAEAKNPRSFFNRRMWWYLCVCVQHISIVLSTTCYSPEREPRQGRYTLLGLKLPLGHKLSSSSSRAI